MNKTILFLLLPILLLTACQPTTQPTTEATSTPTPTPPPTATLTPSPTPLPLEWEDGFSVIENLTQEDFDREKAQIKLGGGWLKVIFEYEGIVYSYEIKTFGEMSDIRLEFTEEGELYLIGIEKGSDWSGVDGKTVVSDIERQVMKPILDDFVNFYDTVVEVNRRYDLSSVYPDVVIDWSIGDSRGYIPGLWSGGIDSPGRINVTTDKLNLYINNYYTIPFGDDNYINIVEFVYKNDGVEQVLYGSLGAFINGFELLPYFGEGISSFDVIQGSVPRGSFVGVNLVHGITINPSASDVSLSWHTIDRIFSDQEIDSEELQKFINGIKSKTGIYPVEGVLPILSISSTPH